MVREHVDTSLPSTVVVLDTRAERYSAEAFEEAVDVAASVVAASLARGFPVRLITTSGATFLARRGQRGQDLQDFLASVLPEADASFGKAIVEVLRGREHDAITVVGSEIDAADLAEITTITQRFASPSLVTLRPSRPGLNAMWSRGLHLDAPTAIAALVRWQTTVTSRDPEAAMS